MVRTTTTRRVLLALIGCLTCPLLQAELVVERIDQRVPAFKSGLVPGARLFGWNTERAEGELDSPFHFHFMVTEYALLEPTRLRFATDSGEIEIRFSRDDAELALRPSLTGELDQRVGAASQLVEEQNLDGASVEVSALLEILPADQWSTRLWLRLRLAGGLMRGGRHDQALQWLAQEQLDWPDPAELDWLPAVFAERRARILERHPDPEIGAAAWDWAIELADTWDEASQVAAYAHFGRGGFGLRRRDLATAQARIEHALALRKARAPVSIAVAQAESSLGVVAAMSGDAAGSIEGFSKALVMLERVDPDANFVGSLHSNLGISYRRLGDYRKAHEHYALALAHHERLAPNGMAHGHALNNLGALMKHRGDLAEAERLFRQALEIRQTLDPRGVSVGRSLGTLANLELERGNLEQAAKLNDQALAWAEQAGAGPDTLFTAWGTAGEIALRREDYQAAIEAFVNAKKLGQGGRGFSNPGFAHQGQARAWLALGDLAQALQQAQLAVEINRQASSRNIEVAEALVTLGQVQRTQLQYAPATVSLTESLVIQSELSPDAALGALIRHELALTAQAQGDFEAALEHYRSAVDILAAQARRIGGDEATRAMFESDFADLFRDYLQLQLQLNDTAGAFETLESSRARRLRVLLAQRDIQWELSLPAELRAERQALTARYDELTAKLRGQRGNPNGAARLQEELDRVAGQRRALVDQAFEQAPELAHVVDPHPVSLAEVRDRLDPGSVVVSYLLSDDELLIFALRGGQPEPTVLTRALDRDALVRQVTNLRRSMSAPTVAFDGAAAGALYDQLIAPLAEWLVGAERLIVVPDGALHALPFAALKSDAGFLVEQLSIDKITSLSVLDHLAGRSGPATAAGRQLVAYADPSPHPAVGGAEATGGFAAAAIRSGWLKPLPGSRDEVQRLQRVFPATQIRADRQATEESVKSLRGDFPVVHFAVHGVLDSRRPLDSFLALAAPSADSRDNGFLQVWEVFESVRMNADLVTLSACRSGLGFAADGEGVVGLVRAFQYAGAKNVLASLWDISDRSTAALMEHFYSGLARGQSKSQALANSQRQMLAPATGVRGWWARLRGQPDWRHPYYWAAFELHGPG